MNAKLKTILLRARGQIVIPQEFREDLKLKENDTLLMIERDHELIIKKEESVLDSILRENTSPKEKWQNISEKSLKKVWKDEKDELWESYL